MQFIALNSTYASQEDDQLLAAYRQSGKLDILAALYERYMGMVYGVCLKYLKNDPESKDAVMEIFESLQQKVLKHEIRNFKSWLHVVVKNHCLMAIRKGKGHELQTIDENFMHLPASDHLEDVLAKEKSLDQMEKCLETLGKEQQTSVRLFYLEEKCYQEVADLTGYELVKVRSYIQNGRRNLKICMEKQQSE